MSAILAVAALGLALSTANSVVLFFQSRRTKDAAATDVARRTLQSEIQSDLRTTESSLRADLQIVGANLRKEVAEAKLAAAESRTAEYTQAVSSALKSVVLATRPASQSEIRAGR